MTQQSYNSNNNNADLAYGAIPVMPAIAGPASILDDKDPLVIEREHSQKQKKLGVAALLTVVLAALTATVACMGKNTQQQEQDLKSLQEKRFASVLVDDQAFFFPSATTAGDGRRSLVEEDADSTNPWALAWKDNKADYAAIGAYYRAKGKALKHYYKSKYDPKYNKTAEEAGVANVTLDADAAPWAFDWKKDATAGLVVADKYKSIGDAIDEHYKQAFAPAFAATVQDDPDGRRFLRALAEDDANPAASPYLPVYDWAADRERGMAIGEHFKELGQQIKEHYEQEPTDATASAASAPVDWSTAWMDFKTQGKEIGKYYRDKGIAISRFYEQQTEAGQPPAANAKVSLADATSASIAGAPADAADTPKNDWYIWGMDWQHDKEHAASLHEEMKAKGQAIANYYRAKFDPTFFANAISNSLDGLSFPTWGEDAEADKAHGKAIGEYWAANGKKMGKEVSLDEDSSSSTASGSSKGSDSGANYWKEQGEAWKERGRSTGKFWEDFYRSKFDPTYDSSKDMDW